MSVSWLVVLLFVGVAYGQSLRFTLYSNDRHSGSSYTGRLNRGQCHNLPGWMNDKGSSINTHNNCIRMWEHRDCRGAWKDVYVGGPGHSNFGRDWNDRTSAIGSCG